MRLVNPFLIYWPIICWRSLVAACASGTCCASSAHKLHIFLCMCAHIMSVRCCVRSAPETVQRSCPSSAPVAAAAGAGAAAAVRLSHLHPMHHHQRYAGMHAWSIARVCPSFGGSGGFVCAREIAAIARTYTHTIDLCGEHGLRFRCGSI